MDILLNLDTQLFYFLNSALANPVFDTIMPFITEVQPWILIYLFGFWFLFFKSGKKGKITAITLIITIIATDQINSSLIKEYVGRMRPCHVLDHVRLLVDCGGGKSFPSSHAANNFAAAYVVTYFFKKNQWFFYTIAGLMAFSRVYIGVHYPLDIIGGALVGLIVAYLITFFVTKTDNYLSTKMINTNQKNIFPNN
jgi:undecaprenyl-diphosphatase